MAMEKARLLMRTLLLGLTLSTAAWGQSAQPSFAQPERERPARLPYEAGERIPEGYRLQTGVNKPLVIAGIAVGGAGYAFGVMGAMDLGFEDHSGYLLIPVAGPWLMLAAGRDPAEPCPTEDGQVCPTGDISFQAPAVALDGVVQAVGVVLLATGLTTTRQYLQRKELSVSLMPASFGRQGYGLGAFGTF
jgi:hypothetical protein